MNPVDHSPTLVGPRRLLIAEANGGLAIIGADDPNQPTLHRIPVGRRFSGFERVGRGYWLASGDGIVLDDLRQPLRPRRVSAAEWGHFGAVRSWETFVHNGWAYVRVGMNEPDRVAVFRVSSESTE